MAINGIDFRASSGFVTDAAPDTYCLNFTNNPYPTTRGGRTFGWEITGATLPGSADRSAGGDPRLAGIAYGQNNLGVSAPFRLDVTAGTKRIYLALGDASFSQAYTYFELFDTSTSKLVIDKNTSISANNFWDATGVSRSAANWPSQNVPVDIVFSSAVLRFKLAPVASQSDSSCIAHLAIEDVVVDLPPSTVAMFDPELRVDTWFDADLVTIGWFDEDLIDAALPILLPSGALVPSGTLARSVTRALAGSQSPAGVPLKLSAKPLSGVQVPSGLILRQPQKPLTASQTPSSSIIRSLTKALIGSIAPIGVAAKLVAKLLTGAITPISIAALAFTLRLIGSIVPSGLLGRLNSTRLDGQLIPVSTIGRAAQVPKSGELTPTSLLFTLKLTLQSLAGLVVPSSLTSQNVGRSFFAESIASSIIRRVVFIAESATVAASGSLSTLKAILQSGAAFLNPSGTLVKLESKVVEGQIVASSSLSYIATKLFSGSIAPTSILAAVRSLLLQLSRSTAPSGLIAKLSTKPLASSLSPTGQRTKATTKAVAGLTTPTAVIFTVRQVLLSLESMLVPDGSISRSLNFSLSGVTEPVGSISKFVSRILSAVLSLVGSLLNSLLNPPVKLDVASTDFVVTELTVSDFPVTRLALNDATVNRFSSGDSAL